MQPKLSLPALFMIILFSATNVHSIHTNSTSSSLKVWTFKNWNKYKNEKPSSNPTWAKAWDIPPLHGWAWGIGDDPNYRVVKDPLGSTEYVIETLYRKGSYTPIVNPVGGIGFYCSPLEYKGTPKVLTLEFQVMFPNGFDFVLAGKLPGLWANQKGCTGGDPAIDCFSTRYMWRPDGAGEMYAYLNKKAQVPSLCDPNQFNVHQKIIYCNSITGISIGRGTFTFQTGIWNTIRQELRMNSPGKQDGQANLFYNGEHVFQQNELAFIKNGIVTSFGIAFHTFFGGGIPIYATPKDQHSYFKNFTYTVR